MALAKVNVTFGAASGFPGDQIVNTLYFTHASPAPTTADIDALSLNIRRFYNDPAANTNDIARYLSTQISRATNSAKNEIYLTAGLVPPLTWGSPYAVRDWTLDAAASSTSMPSEVAAVLTFHGDLTGVPETAGATRPRAQRRGRIYLGPIQTNTGSENVSTGEYRLDPAFIATVTDRASALIDLMATDGWVWVVASRAGGAVHNVVGGWMDNGYDVQRRRGQAPTVRTLWT